MSDTIFDLILAKKIPSWVIWEDASYISFLTPFPNTPGASVVIPKSNQGAYLFELEDKEVSDLILASKKVSKILEKAFNVSRVAMVVEGTAIPYVHVKLYPLHGKLGSQTNVTTSKQEFFDEYPGYLTTVEGPKMSDDELTKLQQQIVEAGKS